MNHKDTKDTKKAGRVQISLCSLCLGGLKGLEVHAKPTPETPHVLQQEDAAAVGGGQGNVALREKIADFRHRLHVGHERCQLRQRLVDHHVEVGVGLPNG